MRDPNDPREPFAGVYVRAPGVKVNARLTGRLFFGFIIIVVGVVFMLDELRLVDAGQVLRWWPVIPLTYGVIRLTGIGAGRRTGLGLVLTIAGGWMLLHNLDLMAYDPWDFWPVALILLGASMVMRSRLHSRIDAAGSEGNRDASFSAFALWSASKRRVISQEFRGGDVTAIMGGHEIDLRAARTVPEGAVLDLFVWWGGVEVMIPEDWSVSCEGLAVMGAIEDNSKPKPPPEGARGHLILKGLVVMGGVEIKNARP